MYPLPKEIEDAFDNSSALAVEVDVNNIDKQKIQSFFMANALYQGDDLLWNHVGEQVKQRVEQFCGKYELPSERFAKLKPWVAAFVAAMIPTMKSGIDPSLGIDK